MALDITPLKSLAIVYLGKEEKDLTVAENNILDEICHMMADFDARFIQYPLLAGDFVARSIKYGRTDVKELRALLDMLIAVDTLKGKK